MATLPFLRSFAGSSRPVPPVLAAMLGLIMLLATLVPALLVARAPRGVFNGTKAPVKVSHRIVPKNELPPVEPVELQVVTPDDARTWNASVPFSTLPNPAARPFNIFGSQDSRARAVDCLAAAVYYEAGDDAVGQKAVAQVIINRARHPAFPKTICGVVFQGFERSTGCQFTFTCDGAMLRYSPTATAWERARFVARAALTGSVYKPVGHATHYHTDWVVPYWSASLEKITAVHTHLFFRWAGWWGTPPAFNRAYAGIEPNIGLMARLSPANFKGDPAALDALMPGAVGSDGAFIDPATIPTSAIPAPMPVEGGGDSNNFMLTLPAGMNPDAFAALAIRTCGERPYCKFMAWADPKQTPARLPLGSSQVATMSFSYLRDETQGFAKALWNCQQFRRPSPVQCMRAQISAAPETAPAPAASPVPGAVPVVAPTPLTGIRRKVDAVAPSVAAPANVPAQGKSAVNFSLPVPKPSPTPRPTPVP